MIFLRKTLALWPVALLLVALPGCGGRLQKVTGTLTYKSQPVPNAIIDFVPEKGRPSSGETDDQGHFKLAYDRKTDGVELGKHKVYVRPKPGATPQREPGMAPAQPRDLAVMFDKYSPAKSTKEVTIDSNTTDLKLDLD
jgi:hypothetical protein